MPADESARPIGRPPLYSEELAAAVCQRMAEGESLLQICRDPAMPSYTTVMKWARENPAFAESYARAREALLEYHAEEIVEISDDGTNDWTERETKDGRTERVFDHEHVARSKLRVDARKWLLSHLLPKKYGDRLVTQNQQLDANGNPITPGPTFVIAREEAKQIAEDLDDQV